MELDDTLILALQQYGNIRKHINRDIAHSIPTLPRQGGDILHWIVQLEQPNITALADAMGFTRGGVSKGVSRLQAAGLVEGYQLPDNRKEVYLRLTPMGESALEQLRQLRENLKTQERAYIATLSNTQKQTVLEFFDGFTAHLSAISEQIEKLIVREGDQP